MKRQLSFIDNVIVNVDRVIRTLNSESISPARHNPATDLVPGADDNDYSETEKSHVAGLMRINHTGEVCAQALYQGQALTARDPQVRDAMQSSAEEEEDHLAWCEQRLAELNSRPSYLNPLFYGLSFGIGAVAGIAGDKWSLGFISATEDKVCEHLESHLEQIPQHDKKSRAILSQMLIDEQQHGQKALDYGGVKFNERSKKLMALLSTVMTKTTYKL